MNGSVLFSKFSPAANATSTTATRPCGGGAGRFPGCSTNVTSTQLYLTLVPRRRPPNRSFAPPGPRLSCGAHAEPPRQAAEGRAGDREAGAGGRQGSAARVREAASRAGEAGLRRGAPAPRGVRGPRSRAGGGAPQGSGEAGRGAHAVGARAALAATGGDPPHRGSGRDLLPLRPAQREDRAARRLAADAEGPGAG